MPESLGARLRQKREEQQIDLRTIADQTKIKMSLLEGLERDDVSRWPSGIFRRTYVRDYARAIGLPADEIVREFLQRHPDPEDICTTRPEVWSPAGRNGNSAGSGRLRQAIGSIVGALSGGRSSEAKNQVTTAPVIERPPALVETPAGPDLRMVAELCTRLARVDRLSERKPLLADIVAALGGRGVIVWTRNHDASALKPALAWGYRAEVLAKLTPVGVDEVNATAVAYRTARVSTVTGSQSSDSALAVPLMAPSGCVGVLGIEFAPGYAPTDQHRAVATIVAAQVARLVVAPSRQDRRRAHRHQHTHRGVTSTSDALSAH
jgi:transcriptional regulator with XRE-family HTH domain